MFPPLTTLEVCGTKVEGAVLIVQLRPSMKDPGTLKTGVKDIEAAQKAREDAARAIVEAREREESEKKRNAAAMAVKQRQMHWQSSLMDVKVAASRRQAAALQSKLLHEKKVALSSALHSAVDVEAKSQLTAKLASMEAELAAAQAAQEEALLKAEAAAAGEKRAMKLCKEAEHKVGVVNWKLTAQVGQAQLMKGLLRAKEAAALKQKQDLEAAAKSIPEVEVQVQEEAPPPAVEEQVEQDVRVPVDHGPLGDVGGTELVQRFSSVVGEPDTWPVRGVQAEDIEFLHSCCEKVLTLCGRGKKQRKAMAQAGLFEHLSKAMKRYECDNMLRLKCLEAMAACAKKAEGDKIQDESATCIAPLIETMDGLLINAYDLIENITRNHRDNSVKLIRLGGRVDWLAPDSNIVPPDQGPLAPRKKL